MFIKRTIQTPIGNLVLVGSSRSIEYIRFGIGKLPLRYEGQAVETTDAFRIAVEQLGEYFDGKRKKLTFSIELLSTGFQRNALTALQRVGYGETVSYKELATMAGSENAFRAAGTACAENPLPIVIPCHRVLKADGTLGGFGGGIETKKRLLDIEHAKYRE